MVQTGVVWAPCPQLYPAPLAFGEPFALRYNGNHEAIRSTTHGQTTLTWHTGAGHVRFMTAKRPLAAHSRPNRWPILLSIALILVLAGCRNQEESTISDGPQLAGVLPADWIPLTFGREGLLSDASAWQEINIDDDLPPEYLLFFTYDNGQVGALIYDQQTGPSGIVSATPVPAPNQPVGTYIPYRVEPSYWTKSTVTDTVGFMAPPGTGSDAITLDQVQRLPPDPNNPAAGQSTTQYVAGGSLPPNNELIVFGGTTTISVLWWRNAFNGYGITQMYAPGGLVFPLRQESSDERPLASVTGLTPEIGMLGRSNVCRQKRYMRANTAEPPDVVPPVFQTAVQYDAQDRGLVFCQYPPPFPFYPEGVVLGYLRPENPADPNQNENSIAAYRDRLVWVNVAPEQRQAFLATIDLDGPETPGIPTIVVQELRTPATIPMRPNYRTPAGGPLTTAACVQVTQVDGSGVRRLLFELVHTPPTDSTSGATPVVVPDRLYIANITDITNVVATCSLLAP